MADAAPQQRRLKTLPSHYYREHFCEMLDFVVQHYESLLDSRQRAFINEFRALGTDQQCLYVRLVNRKGRAFVRSALRYPEIANLDDACDALQASGWIGQPQACDLPDILDGLTKDLLMAASRVLGLCLPRGIRKPDLVAALQESSVPQGRLAKALAESVIVQGRVDELLYLLYLYFGHTAESLGRFTMRDLGLTRTQDINELYEPRFGDRDEALEHYYFASRLARLRSGSASVLPVLLAECDQWPDPEFPGAARLRDKLAARLGRCLEEVDASADALQVYALGESLRCTERRTRLLFDLGRRDAAARALLRSIEQPRSDEERLFAEDLYARKFNKKRTANVTDNLRSAAVLRLDESLRGSPERAAKQYYERDGFTVFRTENTLWRMLFGLVFWDELFGAEATGVHSPFEFLPKVLSDDQFERQFSQCIKQRFTKLSQRTALVRHVLRKATEHYGVDNGVFRWRQSTLDAVMALINTAEPAKVLTILRHLCRSYRDSRTGFPDLMRIREKEVSFVEIKAEGDQLRRNQLLRLQWLNKAGFEAAVACVEWIIDPQQTYVVVDVETTGGRGDQHRITEVAAIKVCGTEKVDHFQSLINPDRSIPAGITRLTGISNAMVAEAPRFSEIAEALHVFLEGSIFVAHNVNFDYGFIAREFARVQQPFRAAKLCTVASMRKYYPGHSSYSLAALCERYEIGLDTHHRAMCDAQAAMELLLMVNAKRVTMSV